MNKPVFFLFIALYSSFSLGQDNYDCRFYVNCGATAGGSGSGRSSAQSLPSSSTAASFNPGSISKIRGVGLETLFMTNNPVGLSLVSGNGKIGALISPTLENSFFGNRSIELAEDTYRRHTEKVRYKNKKLNLSVGLKIFDRKYAAMDLGISVKRNPLIKNLNPGVGLSARLSFLNLGVYYYKDDVSLDLGTSVNPETAIPYSVFYGSSTYKETFSVLTYTVGTRIRNVSLDAGFIKTKYNFYMSDTLIKIYSGSVTYKDFLFNFAHRKEESPNPKFMEGMMLFQREKTDIYLGVQYLLNKHIMIGAHKNHFLLDDWSATLTLFY